MATTQEADTSLTSAVEKAVETQDKVIEQDQSQQVIEKEAPATEEPEVEEVEESEGSDLSDVETEEGRTLIRALKDPNRAPLVIDFLATQAGYTKANVQTKADVKEAKKEITQILEKHLGDDFKFLASRLAPAIEESLGSLLQGRDENSDIRQRLERQELREIQNETAQAHIELAREWFGTDDMPANVVKAMSAAIDEFTPSDPNISPAKYYRKIFSLVAGELGLTKKGTQVRGDRIARNRGDEVARNLTQSKGVSPTTNGENPRRLSLKDAVSLAVEQVDQASRK